MDQTVFFWEAEFNLSVDRIVFLPNENSWPVLFLCMPKEKERKRKGTKIKDQDALMPHDPPFIKCSVKDIYEV
ncbi:MAG: hypothetical protein MI975_06585 [Cytophagales bacterium]|nr:hypothetical protein [Cytophagales bacterium]